MLWTLFAILGVPIWLVVAVVAGVAPSGRARSSSGPLSGGRRIMTWRSRSWRVG